MILETTVIVSIVGWAASPVVNKLADRLQWYLVQRFRWHEGLPGKLETLADFLDEIGSAVNVVGARGFRDPKMTGWLCQLRGAADEVDHIFDVLDYKIIESSSSRPDDDPAAAAGRGEAAPIGSPKLCARLNKLLAKLNDIRLSSRGLVQASMLAVAGAGDGRSRSVTGPLLPQGLTPLGYDRQYEHLRTWLLQSPQGRDGVALAPVFAIIGHGGMGKTTLAQRAWGDEEVQRTFNLVIWAWVYNKTSEADLLGEIWRSAEIRVIDPISKKKIWRCAGRQHEQEPMSFGGMQLALQELVASKRYLLVLDDVCNDEAATERQRRDMWSAVLAPFRQPQDIGSRVLVTTRAGICADTLDSGDKLTLDGIGYEPFVSLLLDTAAPGTGSALELEQFIRSNSLFPESRRLARRLAPNLRYSPLSATEMGLELRDSRGKTKWAEIMETDSHRNVVSVHESSFRHLPPHLQHCCAFISLFPDRFRFLPEMLVNMWIADGFISGDDGMHMEETATGYFNDLLARSLLQPVQDGHRTYYVVHQEIHSMIRSVSAGYFLMMQPNNCAAAKIPHTVRHLSVITASVARLKKLSLLKRLRTFIVLGDPSAPDVTAIDEDLLEDILKELEGVRVLDFTGTDIQHVPSEIGNRIHLRCLALPQTVQTFPEEFSKLFHLQTVIRSAREYDQADEVHYYKDPNVAFKLNVIARSRTSSILKPKYRASLKQLNRMNSLRGSLIITGLDLVASKEDAQEARLNSKKSVRALTLEWEVDSSTRARVVEYVWEASVTDLEVLEGLQPHTGLQKLRIEGYRGILSPSWLFDNFLSQLTHLHIKNCRNWTDLPPFGDLPLLNHLQITDLESVTSINDWGLFKSLETLVLSDMKSLKTWWPHRATDRRFTALKKIEISDCPILKLPPPFPPTLESLTIWDCPELIDEVRDRYSRGKPQPRDLYVDFTM